MNTEIEIWTPIVGYEGWYEVSSFGRFRRVRAGMSTCIGNILKGGPHKQGYWMVDLSMNGKSKKYQAHRLVARAFIPNPENKPEVNHRNGIKDDNRISNLEWVTPSENVQHAFDTGLEKPLQGESHHRAKLTNADVITIRELLAQGFSCIKIAKQFGMCRNSILNIRRRETWSHL